jgi:hypothetical protein
MPKFEKFKMLVAECFGNLMGLLWIIVLLKKNHDSKAFETKASSNTLFFFPTTWLFFSVPFGEIYF